MEFLAQYGLFLAKAITLIITVIVVMTSVIAISANKSRKNHVGSLEIKKLNDHYKELKNSLSKVFLDKSEYKKQEKLKKKERKIEEKKQNSSKKNIKPRLFVLDFNGDIKAKATDSLREEVTAILSVATGNDEVLVRLESGGGFVNAYGLAASQLQRLRDREIKLTISVDKVAASGGYMMACVANHIISAPFAVIGSIGVIAQLPNVHRLLKKNDIDVEIHTAGKYKRTLTMLGENTDVGREKFKEDLQETHDLFKNFVKTSRNKVNIEELATGEIWYGQQAVENLLVDEIKTSDQYIYDKIEECDVVHIAYVYKKNIAEKFGFAVHKAIDSSLAKWWEKLVSPRQML